MFALWLPEPSGKLTKSGSCAYIQFNELILSLICHNKFKPKASTMFIGDLATVASAAPTATTPEKRSAVDLAAFNQFRFVNQELQYFNAINAFGLLASEQLAAFNNLSISGFQDTLRQQCVRYQRSASAAVDSPDLAARQHQRVRQLRSLYPSVGRPQLRCRR